MKIKNVFAAGALAIALASSFAHAALIDFRITLTKELVSDFETIGGIATPVVFDFIIDSNAPNIGSSTQAFYQFGPAPDGFGSVSVGGAQAVLTGGGMQVLDNHSGMDIFNGQAAGTEPGDLINGRPLYIAGFSLVDWSGQAFSSIALPPLSSFNDLSLFGGSFYLIFRPGPNDTGNVKFDAFAASSDFTISVTAVPEPGTVALLGIALAGLGATRRRKPARLTHSQLTR